MVSDLLSILDIPKDFEELDSNIDYSLDEPTNTNNKLLLDSLISDTYKLDKLIEEIIIAKERSDY